jgi:hypothetical protein
LCLTIGQQIFAARRTFGSSMERPGGESGIFVAAQYVGLIRVGDGQWKHDCSGLPQAHRGPDANQCLKRSEKEGLLRIEYGGVTVVDLDRLRHYGE